MSNYSHIFNSVGPTLIIALHPTHSTAPAHWRTSRTSNEMARMGLPEKTNRTLVLKLPTPLGTHVAACRAGALLWQNALGCTRLCGVRMRHLIGTALTKMWVLYLQLLEDPSEQYTRKKNSRRKKKTSSGPCAAEPGLRRGAGNRVDSWVGQPVGRGLRKSPLSLPFSLFFSFFFCSR